MPRPTLYEQVHFLTSTFIAHQLGIDEETLVRRIKAGMYPPPVAVNGNGVRLFTHKWLEKVLAS